MLGVAEWLGSVEGRAAVLTEARFGGSVGIDAGVTSAGLASSLRAAFACAPASEDEACRAGASSQAQALSHASLRLERVACGGNPVDAVWGSARPAAPSAPARAHALEFAGETVGDKLRRVRHALAASQAQDRRVSALVVAALDEVCWLFNVRGADVACNPVAFSYALVTLDHATLFIDASKLQHDEGTQTLPARPRTRVCGEKGGNATLDARFV